MKEYTILIVDDSRMIREIVKGALAEFGRDVRVIEASDGAAAVELYRQHFADLVFMDIAMPGIDGLEALHEIKQCDPYAHVVLLTAQTAPATIARAKEFKAEGYITKPFEPARIVRTVKEHMALDREGHHVLIVDDSRTIRFIIRRILNATPYRFRIREAEDGQQALKLFAAHAADLVFLDIHMPHMTGIEVLPHIRHHVPEPYVIMVTSDSSTAAVKAAKALGVREYLLKPFATEQVVALIDHFLKQQAHPEGFGQMADEPD